MSRLRLFCLPYAGASAVIFRPWAKRLPGWIDVRPVELPGRGTRVAEMPVTDFRSLVHRLADELSPELDRPFAIFGHSLGGLIGFELACELRHRRAREPDCVFVSAVVPPDLGAPIRPLHDASTPDLLRILHRLGGTPPEILTDANALEAYLPIVRADFELLVRYERTAPRPLDGPLIVFAGAADTFAPPRDLDGWRRHTVGPFARYVLPGDHFFLRTEETMVLSILADALG